MPAKDPKELEKRLEKLKATNRVLRETLNALKKGHQELQNSYRNRNRLFDAAPVGILLIQQEKIIDINGNALEGLGYSSDEVLGRKFLDFVDPKRKTYVRNLHRRRLAGKRVPDEYEIELLKKDGTKLGCDLQIKKIRFKGRKAFLVSMLRHEKRKARERELVHSKKTEALLTMTAGLTQTLGQALKALEKNMERLREEGVPETASTGSGLKGFRDAMEGVRQAAAVLEGMMDAEGRNADGSSFDLRTVVREAVATAGARIREEAGHRGVDINFKTYLRSMSPVKGNAKEIQEVVIHLIQNAAEAMPKGGDIYLTTEENAGMAHIFVQDNGGGIPAAIEDRLFDPFFSTKKMKGAGLGLSICRTIVQRHGGEIEMAGNGRRGTLVVVRLPLGKSEDSAETGPAKRTIKGTLVLVLEPEDMIRELLSQMLENKGCRVVTASGSKEGLNRLKRRPFDLVIANGALDNIDAGVLVKRIRQNRRAKGVALIDPGGAEGLPPLLDSGADLIITKPIDMNRAMKQICQVLASRPPMV